MDPIISAKSEITQQDFVRLSMHTAYKRGRRLKPAILFNIVIMAAIPLIVVWLIASYGVESVSGLPIAAFCIVTLAFPLLVLLQYINTVKSYKSSTIFKGIHQAFEFHADTLSVQASSSTYDGNSTHPYAALHRVDEVKDAFYLYISANQAYFVAKRNMDASTVSAMRDLLMSKLGSKYIICI